MSSDVEPEAQTSEVDSWILALELSGKDAADLREAIDREAGFSLDDVLAVRAHGIGIDAGIAEFARAEAANLTMLAMNIGTPGIDLKLAANVLEVAANRVAAIAKICDTRTEQQFHCLVGPSEGLAEPNP